MNQYLHPDPVTIVMFAGRRFEYLGMHSKPQCNYPGYVEMRPVDGVVHVRARADMVTIGG